MSDPRDRVRLLHMLEAARKMEQKIQGRTRADLDTDEDFAAALVWRLTTLGEAAARVSQPTRDQLPAIPWPQIVALRNRLVHGYDSIDLDLVWQILQHDMPPLIAELATIVPSVP